MARLTESAIEDLAIKYLEAEGYSTLYGPTIAHDGEAPERDSFQDAALLGRLEAAVVRLNPTIPAKTGHDAVAQAIRQIQRLNAPDLITNNQAFHCLLTEGIAFTYQKDGSARGDLVWLVDFDHPGNNEYLVFNQFTVIENGVNKRPDVAVELDRASLIAGRDVQLEAAVEVASR